MRLSHIAVWPLGLCLFLAGSGCGMMFSTFVPVSALPTPTPQRPSVSPPTPTVQMTATPTAEPTVTPSPTPVEISAYTAYRVQPGDTLEAISRRGGSIPTLVADYNRLVGELNVGRELIVPQVRGAINSLPKKAMMVIKGNTVEPWVALTFDCGGDNPRAHDILATLKAAQVRVTFFLLGSSIINDAELLRRMVADGHELANHSYTHADFTTLTDAQIADELRRTEVAVQAIVGPEVSLRPYFRFPYGAYDRRTLDTVIANGYLPIHWTLDSLDAVGEPKTPEFLAERITATLPQEEVPGAIILAHCIGKTADALPVVLETFAAQGIEVRPLSDVLGP